jgi:NDP-hexose-3-ketoreductase
VHLLILGCSSIVTRRVLPAALACGRIHRISLASRTTTDSPVPDRVTLYRDYDDAISASGADVAYVSGVNAAHAEWIARALTAGLHVMVDKPAVLDVASAESVVALARRVRRGIGEATVFAFHPQIAALRALVPPADLASTRATASFSIPPLPPSDFRYRHELGGGSLYDLGPYAATTSRLLFGEAPASVACTVLSTRGAPAVDTSFSMLLTYPCGGSLAGHYGFVTTYQNRLSVLSGSRVVDAERIFSTPPELACAMRVREPEGERIVAVPAADAFTLFLDAFTAAVDRGDFEAFESALLEDARLIARLRDATGHT